DRAGLAERHPMPAPRRRQPARGRWAGSARIPARPRPSRPRRADQGTGGVGLGLGPERAAAVPSTGNRGDFCGNCAGTNGPFCPVFARGARALGETPLRPFPREFIGDVLWYPRVTRLPGTKFRRQGVDRVAVLCTAERVAVDPADELVDVVDEDDRVVATVTRREVRQRSLLHRCTYVLLENAAGAVLVHRRTPTKDVHPGAYDVFAGGVCGTGESYDECARREVAEEVGVEGAELAFRFKHRYRGPTGQAWGAVYEGRWDGPVRP